MVHSSRSKAQQMLDSKLVPLNNQSLKEYIPNKHRPAQGATWTLCALIQINASQSAKYISYTLSPCKGSKPYHKHFVGTCSPNIAFQISSCFLRPCFQNLFCVENWVDSGLSRRDYSTVGVLWLCASTIGPISLRRIRHQGSRGS